MNQEPPINGHSATPSMSGLPRLMPPVAVPRVRRALEAASTEVLAADLRARRVGDFLNHRHPFLVEALFSERTGRSSAGARVRAIERDGLVLIGADRSIFRVAFRDVSPNAADVFDAILRLVRNVGCFSNGSDAEESASALSRLMMPGVEPEPEVSRNEVRSRRHGCFGDAPPPGLAGSLKTNSLRLAGPSSK